MNVPQGVEAAMAVSAAVKSRPTKARAPSTIDALAELLAGGVEIPEAAARLGISRQQANALLQRMRQQLGPQAR